MTDPDQLSLENSRKQLGCLLIKHREERDLSVDEVANALKVLPTAIVGIENADYSSIKGEIFVRGYIRSYVQFLGINEAESLALYGDLPIDEPFEKIPPPLIRSEKNDQVIKVAISVVILVVCLCLAYWFLLKEPSSPELNSVPVNVANTLTEVTPTDITTPADNGLENINESTAELSDLLVETPQVETSEIISEPEGDLKLVFTEDCWVEVVDSEGNKLLADLKRQGDEVNFSGIAPYNLLLGYGPAVDVFYKGEKVIFDVNLNNPTVKLTVGDKS